VRGQLCAQRDDERPVLLVERADSAEPQIVARDLLEPLRRDIPVRA